MFTFKCVTCGTAFTRKRIYHNKPHKNCSRMCYEVYLKSPQNRLISSKAKLKEKNPMWVGDKVKEAGLHTWVKNRKQKPLLCEMCNEPKKLDLANIADKPNPETYTRDLKNWEWLCRKCHMTKDGRLEKFINLSKTKKP